MIRIIGFGDTDTTADAYKLQEHVVKVPDVDVFLGLGDYPYSSRSTKWCSMMDQYYTPALKAKLMLNQGNHEDEESETEASQQDIEKWVNAHNSANPQFAMPKLDVTPPEAQGGDSSWEKPTWLSSRQVGNVYIINMNTQDMDVEFKRNQYNWVVAEINKAKQLKAEGKIDWIIATSHKPWFTLKSSHSPYTAVRKIYTDLFKDVVDFNLHGHNHNTQMWLPMVADDTTGNGTGTQLFTWADEAQKIFDFTKPHGWLTIVSGHAGHEHNAIKEIGNKNCMWFNDSDYGYTQIDIDGKKAHVIAKDITGKTLFEYKVTKEGGSVPPPANALAKLFAPSQVIPGQNVILDGSGSIADTFTITQTLGQPVNLIDAGTFKKSFTVPSMGSIKAAATFQLGFKAEARKGNSQSIAQVSIQVTTNEPPPPTTCPNGQCKDRVTGICRSIGINEYKDSNGLCTVNTPPPPPPEDGKLTPISIAASKQDLGKEASKAADGDMESRWSADGDGEWIEFRFDKVYSIRKVKLNAYHYDKTYFFEINGKRFECPAGRPINALVEFDLTDLNIVSDTIRLIGHGNSVTTYNSYREIEFYSGTADPHHCQPGWHWDNTLKKCIPDLEPSINPTNKPPVANAGADQTVSPGSTVTLNGLGSSDPDGTISSYLWTQISGPTVQINNANNSVATFTAPDGSQPPPPDKKNPIAKIIYSPTKPKANDTISIDGSTSTDPDGNIVSYKWLITDQLVIANPSAAKTSFNIGTKQSVDLTLEVTDNDGLSNRTVVTIVPEGVNPPPLPSPVAVITPSNPSGTANSIISLSGSNSQNADTYTWSATNATIIGSNTSPNIQVQLGSSNGSVTLTVRNNNSNQTHSVSVVLTVGTVPPPPPPGGFGTDTFGMKMLFKPTGKKVAMEWGTDHENGQRFNVNHELHNYIMQGYFKLGSGQDAINHKGDGPNHGGCTSTSNFICLWYELHLELSTGKGELQYEFPHPKNNSVSDSKLELAKSVGKLNAGQWIGWATAYYWGADGYRHIKAFVDKNAFPNNDPNQKPNNNWELVVYAIEKGQIVPNITMPRNLQAVIDSDEGFESEIRMNNANSGTTDMKNVWVLEIDPKATAVQPILAETIDWQVLPDKGSKERRAADEERDRILGIDDSIKAKPKTSIINVALPTDLVFQLRVTDNKGSNSVDTARITVSDTSQPDPIANLSAPSQVLGGSNVILDGSQSVADTLEITQTLGQTVNLSDIGTFKKQFTAPNGNLSLGFQAIAKKGTKQSIIQKSIQVTTQPPDPSNGEVLWDSNIHLKTGQKFTVNGTHGSQEADGKGVFMAASGSPKLEVEADGIFHLVANAGHGRVYIQALNYNARMEGEVMMGDDFDVVRNTTWRLRSRHNEGGDCENRFGGFGATHEMQEQLAEYATEPCHNIHENTVKKPLTKKVQQGQWIKFKFSVCDTTDKKKVLFKTEYDYNDGQGWVTVLEGEHSSPKPYYMDEESFKKRSMAWLRINNEATGKVTYRNVKIIKLNAGALG